MIPSERIHAGLDIHPPKRNINVANAQQLSSAASNSQPGDRLFGRLLTSSHTCASRQKLTLPPDSGVEKTAHTGVCYTHGYAFAAINDFTDRGSHVQRTRQSLER
ncbi:hypothetical protein PLUA15_240300 [Pseudomonas lundensis]|uniref:Uncharacterized protein n=1 Tax=Pseudomonas lundensis TaxID=86185 RepID=A0AAX2H9B5_9PSED|nr:hypothetical protein PLUA15_240300 [Pseudomonas lundensis]